MEVLKKRSTAVIIAVVVMAASLIFGVHKSLGNIADDIQRQFYDGVYLTDEEYTQKSIESQLDARLDASLGLISTLSGYPELSAEIDALRSAKNALYDADTIDAKWSANETLESAYAELCKNLGNIALGESNADAVEYYCDIMTGAQNVIEDSAYNDVVAQFENETLTRFPVNVLKHLAFIESPAYFGSEG